MASIMLCMTGVPPPMKVVRATGQIQYTLKMEGNRSKTN